MNVDRAESRRCIWKWIVLTSTKKKNKMRKCIFETAWENGKEVNQDKKHTHSRARTATQSQPRHSVLCSRSAAIYCIHTRSQCGCMEMVALMSRLHLELHPKELKRGKERETLMQNTDPIRLMHRMQSLQFYGFISSAYFDTMSLVRNFLRYAQSETVSYRHQTFVNWRPNTQLVTKAVRVCRLPLSLRWSWTLEIFEFRIGFAMNRVCRLASREWRVAQKTWDSQKRKSEMTS